ncbi:MAG TPA: DUF3419 domain-containing protein [Rhodospirillaceae bacterium]|jgi:S-adenosylmethionine-diacylglycerol 3-amino-3-carboxypropyl transferase|nr:DUF3419 family protein [Alphaproteobacteria bacterium]HBH26203.1 DUF3419 domain-containing protein [Rhodospirillaceae bacterium]
MTPSAHALRTAHATKKQFLKDAVLTPPASHRRGVLNRLFTLMFGGFVYPQIWEDPEVDIAALGLTPGQSRILTIASGGCNVLNYLTEGPARVDAVDLNPAHVALTRLKIAALRHLPDYESFFLFFGCADDKANIEAYTRHIAPHLDPTTRAYWEARELPWGLRRITYFQRNLYRFGLLGRFIGLIHLLAKMYGKDPREILAAQSVAAQKEIFDRTLGPLFGKGFVRFLCSLPISLYGLGIPPAQFDALRAAGDGDMAKVLKERLERLACAYPIADNYFAWQAFGRRYDRAQRVAVPRYLTPQGYEKARAAADRVDVHHATLNTFLEAQEPQSLDAYVFLDAQDWMNAAQLTALWAEVGRTAAPGARVVFRTAGADSPLEGALPADMRAGWAYDEAACRALAARDRSSIYGGFHVYALKG